MVWVALAPAVSALLGRVRIRTYHVKSPHLPARALWEQCGTLVSQMAFAGVNISVARAVGGWWNYMALLICESHALWAMLGSDPEDVSHFLASSVLVPAHYIGLAIAMLTRPPRRLDLDNAPTSNLWCVSHAALCAFTPRTCELRHPCAQE